MTVLRAGTYNCATPGERNQFRAAATEQLHRELTALLTHGRDGHGLDVLGLEECVGWDLPKVHGFDLIRDRSTPSRANLACYTRIRIGVENVRWHDLRRTWLNQNNNQQHAPRSYLTLDVAGIRFGIVHGPPRQPHRPDRAAQAAAMSEFTSAVVKRAAPWTKTVYVKPLADRVERRPQVWMGDWNLDTSALSREVAKPIGAAHLVGGGIDAAIVRNAEVVDHDYITHAGPVQLRSDHKHALVFEIKIGES